MICPAAFFCGSVQREEEKYRYSCKCWPVNRQLSRECVQRFPCIQVAVLYDSPSFPPFKTFHFSFPLRVFLIGSEETKHCLVLLCYRP